MKSYFKKLMSILSAVCISISIISFPVSAEHEIQSLFNGTMTECSASTLEIHTYTWDDQLKVPDATASETTALTVATATASATVQTTNTASTNTTKKNKPILRGDTNLNNEVSVDDAQLTLKAYTNRIAGNEMGLSAEQIKAADVDNNGEVSVEDAQFILKYYTTTVVAGKPMTWDELLFPPVVTTSQTTITTSTTTTTTTIATTKRTTIATTIATTKSIPTTTVAIYIPSQGNKHDYVCNTKTMVFHYPSCSSVSRMNESNKLYVTWTREEAIAAGYHSCGRCNP